MSFGRKVRKMFGHYENHIAKLYRGFFVDLCFFVLELRNVCPLPRRILEVGCGEGQLTEILNRVFPKSKIIGIDIIPQTGRLFRGNNDHVVFEQIDINGFVEKEPKQFDLIVVADVVHHVPHNERMTFIKKSAEAMATGGVFLLKDWIKTRTPIHWLSYFSDRIITGDHIQYCTLNDLRTLLLEAVPEGRIHAEWRVPPWRNNVVFLLTKTTEDETAK